MLNGIKAGCLVIITAAACLFLWRVDSNFGIIASGIQSSVSKLDTTIDKINAAADKDTAYYQQAAQQLPKTEREIRDLLVHTDKNLNDPASGTIPNVNKAVVLFATDLNETLLGIDKVSASANSTLDATVHVIDTLNYRIADPKIEDTLNHIDLAALHIDQATDNANGALSNINAITAFYNKRLTSPRSFVSTLGRGLFSLIVPGADVYTAYATGTAAVGSAAAKAAVKIRQRNVDRHSTH
jgi:hypothetical protein